MDNMRNVTKVLLLVTIILLSACESEQKRSNTATGMLALRLAASGDVINTTTRTEDGGENEGENTEEDDLVPEIGDFTIAVMDGNVVKTSWDKFSEYPNYAVLPVGAYTLKAYYGDSSMEGFDSPYYEGTQEITIEDDATIEASITCYLTNVKVSVECTNAFKKYFSDYSTTVQSAGGKPVVFAKDEVRAAYVKPGDITVYTDVKKQNGQSAKLNILDIDEAKAREFYRLKLDVDAGSATLKISFDNMTVEEPIEINISDDVLNMQPPFFTRSGYESGVVQEVKEGSAISPLSMLITARNGIKKCVLTTQSTSLIAQGWPVSVDLVDPKEGELAKMKTLGLSMRGLSTNVDKMATLDFTEVIPFLQYIDGGAETAFSIVVTDNIGRVNDDEEVIKVKALDNQFTVGTVDNVDLGVYAITVPVTLDGDISRLKFQYLNGEVWTNISVANVVTEGIQHKVTLALPSMASMNFQIKVTCGARSLPVAVGVNPLAFTLQASEGDMWATKATIHVVGKNEGATEYLKTQPVVIEYIKISEFEAGEWITPEQSHVGDAIEITGLPEDIEKENAYRLKATLGDMSATNMLDITTEKALQVPNAGFEEWYSAKIYSKSSYFLGMGAGIDIYQWFPKVSASSNSYWGTRNDLTNSQKSGTTCYYTSYSGTIKATKGHTGAAAEISTLGWGEGNTYLNSMSGVVIKNKTAGMLFMGDYNVNASDGSREVYGRTFTSRPKSLSFWYKYNPIDSESFKAYIVVENRDNGTVTELGRAELVSNEAVGEYQQVILNINYTRTALKATHMYIVFLSSTASSPEVGLSTGSYNALKGFSDSRYVGSVLTVDDVKLIY